ncbi:MAG TPA: helix-turn-helix domain-containing protein [Nitrosopumilaceae archaeon]|nr:helix-turn-helix domain-containing protein [Nitrosopumilaceae archaeon]
MKDEELQISIFDSTSDSTMYEHRLSLDKLKDELSKFGLTSNQSKVYIFLGKYGSKTAPEVCKSLKLPRTETYHLLTSLQNKGVVSATFQHPIRFSAVPLDKAIWVLVNAEKERVNTLEKQEGNITDLWNTIPEFAATNVIKVDKFQMLQGINQIHSKIKEMAGSTKKNFFVLGSEKDYLKFYHSDFFELVDNSEIDLKLLTAPSEKIMYVFDEINRDKVKKMSEEIQDNLCFITKDNEEILFFIKNASQVSQQMTAIWTDAASMVYSMNMLFSQVWAKSKNIHL